MQDGANTGAFPLADEALRAESIEAIRNYDAQAPVESLGDAHVVDFDDNRRVFIDGPLVDDPEHGEVYVTYVVRFEPATGKVLNVTHWRSTSDHQTLPP